MKTNRKPQPKRRLTPFERETERRRREMLRNLGGASHTSAINHRTLARRIREGLKTVITQDKGGKDVPMYRGPRPNLWRAMARAEKKRHIAAALDRLEPGSEA